MYVYVCVRFYDLVEQANTSWKRVGIGSKEVVVDERRCLVPGNRTIRGGGGERTEWMEKKKKNCRRRPANNYLDHLSSRLLYLLSSFFLLIFVVVYTFYIPSFSRPTLRHIRGARFIGSRFPRYIIDGKKFFQMESKWEHFS